MKLNKLKGFTIAEAILALMITLMCFTILQNTLGIIKNSEKLKDPANNVAYSYMQLDKFLKRKKHVEIYPDSSNGARIVLKTLVSEKDNGEPVFDTYVIESYHNMVRMSGIDGGHVPLLLNLRSSHFSYDIDEFTISVNEEEGGRSELVFKVDKPLKVKKEKSKPKDVNDQKEKPETSSKRTT
ncbi:competence protein ComGF [Lactobacillus colini]|uniref:Competence protein ComGF n=1 Tax=Lactobacillus colini TaxID=1819254 RepID=A0ABS4MDU8_9LACO|nr:ComGF family competence protein [Lactobacillus colini]MBP2057867.1 competence protein ComGF [Lactobacillus colini]